MMTFAYTTSNTARNIILEVTIKGLMFAIFDFQISELTSAVLSSKRAFLHVDIVVFLFLLGVCVISRCINVIAVLVVERTLRDVIRNFAHAFRINRHRLVSLLGHSENFAHLRRCWGSTANSTGKSTFLKDSILLSQLFKIGMLKSLSC